jgi:hypothetical protein
LLRTLVSTFGTFTLGWMSSSQSKMVNPGGGRGHDGLCGRGGARLGRGGEAEDRRSEPAGDDRSKSELLHFDPFLLFFFSGLIV